MKNEILIKLRGATPRSLVAKELGITPQGLGMIERGERIPRPGLMKNFAVYYKRTVDDLFFNQERHKTCQNLSVLKDCDSNNETCCTLNSKLAG